MRKLSLAALTICALAGTMPRWPTAFVTHSVSAGGPRQLINLIHSGLIDLDQFESVSFDLDHASEAVAHADAAHSR